MQIVYMNAETPELAPSQGTFMKKSGFTLIELSVVLAIIGVILYGSMSILVTGVQTYQVNSTVATMDAIEKALLDFRVAFGRIPCPADITLTSSSANYGAEAANQGSCTGGSPAANFIAASGTAEGGVPTRALRLPDSSMYDGWGHKFRYAVNPNYTLTTTASCSISGTNPSITVNDASGAARSTKAIYAIVSHGANGHGAYTRNGVVVNAGSTNADELTNCHCTSTGAANTYTPTYVQKMPTEATAGSPLTAFDDIVAYKEFWQLMRPNLASNALGCTTVGYYRTITLDHTKVGTVNNTDQSSFPILFSGTYSYLATVANGGLVQNANGYDITFTSDAAGTHLLPFERESYNATTGAVTFWVQVPTVSHSADTVIYLQYDNPNITTDQSNVTGTWNNNYVGVWHMDAATGANQPDSSSSSYTLTQTSSPTQQAGWIAGSMNFNASGSYLSKSSPANLNFDRTNPFTLSFWAKSGSTGGSMVPLGHITSSGTITGYQIYFDDDWYGNQYHAGAIGFEFDDSGGTGTFAYTNTSKIHDGSWHLYELSYNGTSKATGETLYEDGVSLALTPDSNTLTSPTTVNTPFTLGLSSQGYWYAGSLDEVRVSNVVRSADWISTEYNNQNSPDKATYGASGFYTVGAQMSR